LITHAAEIGMVMLMVVVSALLTALLALWAARRADAYPQSA